MSKENMTTESNITPEQMIQLLNEDLAGEYHRNDIHGNWQGQLPHFATAPAAAALA